MFPQNIKCSTIGPNAIAGKKDKAPKMKMASLAVLVMPLVVLLFTAIAVITKAGTNSISNPGAHGFTEILYAFTSMGSNNGSAFAGLNANTNFYNLLGERSESTFDPIEGSPRLFGILKILS